MKRPNDHGQNEEIRDDAARTTQTRRRQKAESPDFWCKWSWLSVDLVAVEEFGIELACYAVMCSCSVLTGVGEGHVEVSLTVRPAPGFRPTQPRCCHAFSPAVCL